MKISLSKYAGFCDGVNRAYKTVLDIVKDPKIKKPIYILGSLVHNNDVVCNIKKMGVKKLNFNGVIKDVEKEINKSIGTLVITAHGIGPKIFEIAEEKNINVIDTTCPKVIKAQKLAEIFWNRNYKIIIIGKKKHKETMGIFRWARKNAIVVESEEDFLNNLNFGADDKIVVVSQTTQNEDKVKKIINKILIKYPNAEILDTVCETTKKRQQEAKKIAKENDLVLVIGSSSSSNSTELWKIAKKINPKTYFIERAEHIKSHWFKNCHSVGITAGASSPQWVIDEIKEYLLDI